MEEELAIPEGVIVGMIEELVHCMNYPRTRRALAHERATRKAGLNLHEHQSEGKGQEHQEEEDPERMEEELEAGEKIQEKEEKKESEIVDQNSKGEQQIIEVQIRQQQKLRSFSKFATFSQILYCLEPSQSVSSTPALSAFAPEINQNYLQSQPALLNVLSAFETANKLKKFTIPVYRGLSVEPKFSKPTKLMEVCPYGLYLLTVDENSSMVLVNLEKKAVVSSLKCEQQPITSIKWLHEKYSFVAATESGRLLFYQIMLDKELTRIETLIAHEGEITAIYSNRYFLYTCSKDYTIVKTFIKNCKVERRTQLRGDWLSRIVKIEHKKLKDIIFGVERRGRQLMMVDEVTGFSTCIFSLAKCLTHQQDYLSNSDRNRQLRNQDKLRWIEDILANVQNDTLLVSVVGACGCIYEIDPLKNQTLLRISHHSLKLGIFPSSEFKNRRPNLHMTLSHNNQLLVVTTNTQSIFYIRLKNWRVLHEHTETGSLKFGRVSAGRRGRQGDEQAEEGEAMDEFTVCVVNVDSGSVEVYGNEKTTLRVLKNEGFRPRSILETANFSNAQGFLELLQSLREGYQH